ncbi:MAG TPA: family 20 glycosylhydrolase [Candidatus Acidoferrales bacterium]|nr:family 20 glycosylhydrolase [Candidatus Acidoferrales bacterium]
MSRKRSGVCVALLTVAGMLAAGGAMAQTQTTPNLMPMPANVQLGSGALAIDATFSVQLAGHTEPRLERSVSRFLEQLQKRTAIPRFAGSVSEGKTPTLLIRTDHGSKAVQELGEDESYTLEVTPTAATLNAPTPLGTMHGLQTFLQLVDVSANGFAAPVVTIKDQPRFAWRGLMIDSARHFMPMDVLKRNIDGMEAVKMNVFHWHLSENQGFRAESKKFPKLAGMGSDGLFYTQAEMREIVEYARDRGIRVVPEFDMPGHSTAWFIGYPELASGKGPYEIERRWGVFDPAMDPTNEKVYKFLDQLIGEMAKIFPDHYFHIGGDEVNGKEWDANPKIQAYMKEHGIASNEALQAYFSGRVQKLVVKHGKAVVGWDEVLVPGVPKDIVIQSWRGQASLAKAAQQGYRGILSNGYYLDLGWSAARHYGVDPLNGDAANLTAEQKELILGGESCMWAEYVDAENVDSRIWPRNAAIAERLWSPPNVTDVTSMYRRMAAESERLEWLGLTHRSYYRLMLQRIAGNEATAEEFAALKTLADLVEPVKDYTRHKTAPAEPTSATPLNRLVDAIPLESEAGRVFNALVESYVAANCQDSATASQLRADFTIWKENDARLRSLFDKSFLAKEVAGNSADLATLGSIGLDALGQNSGGSESSKTALDSLAKIGTSNPTSQLLLIPATGIRKLVEARAAGACAVR